MCVRGSAPGDPLRACAVSTDTDDLDLIPRSIRDKLDRVGIKLHLEEWQMFSRSERVQLRDAPCDTPDEIEKYRDGLSFLIHRRTGHSAQRLDDDPARSSAKSSE